MDSASDTSVDILPRIDIPEIIEGKLQNVDDRENEDDSFCICDLGDIVRKHQRWLKEFPRIDPHYAIKCNPDPIMLKMLLALGTGFDCASKNEICQMLSLGARQDQIIFAHPCKQISHVEYSRDNDVKLTVFDNEEELVKMKKHYPNADLVLRIITDDSTSLYELSNKFGASIDSSKHLIEAARSMCLNVVGISFHVGSGCQDPNAFALALNNARMLFDFAEKFGYKFNLLDIGGGFPGTDNVATKFEQIAKVVNQQLDILFPVEDYSHVRIIAEPGRYYAASAFTLATNVIGKKSVDPYSVVNEKVKHQEDQRTAAIENDTMNLGFMYCINDGVYGSFDAISKDWKPTLLKKSSIDSTMYLSSIFGPTSNRLENIIEQIFLPETEVGDWIIWSDMGAYTFSSSSPFNGFFTKKFYYVLGEEEYALVRSLVENFKMKDVCFICNNEVIKK